MPILVLKGWDDTDNGEIALSANSALVMGPDSDAKYVEPASQAFEAQQNFITELESQMQNLGIATLFNQSFTAETAEARAMERSDSDSMLSVVAQDLEKALQMRWTWLVHLSAKKRLWCMLLGTSICEARWPTGGPIPVHVGSGCYIHELYCKCFNAEKSPRY